MKNQVGDVVSASDGRMMQATCRPHDGDCPVCDYRFPDDLLDAALNVHGGTHSASEYDAVIVALDQVAEAARAASENFAAQVQRRREQVLEWRAMTSSLHAPPKAAS